jgi:glycosyltransferase involved in cell wall biosynthesis
MKIAILDINPYPYTFGGVKARIDGLSKELLKKNEVYVVSLRSGRRKLDFPKGTKVINIGLPYVAFGKSSGMSFLFKLLYRPFMCLSWFFSASIALLKIRPDIIDSQDIVLSALPAIGNNVITPHGIFGRTIENLHSESLLRFFVPFLKLIEKINIRKAKRIIALNEEEKRYYEKKIKTFLVGNGVDLERFKPIKKKKGKNIVYIGRLSREKGVDKVILALKKLPEFNLIIVGEGPERKKLEELSQEQSNVNFVGFRENVERYLDKADYFIMNSSFEVFSFALIEALSAGKIVLSTNVGNAPEIIHEGKNGFLLKNSKEETLIKKFKEISKRKDLKKISENARKTAKKFSWKKRTEEIESVYGEVLKNEM